MHLRHSGAHPGAAGDLIGPALPTRYLATRDESMKPPDPPYYDVQWSPTKPAGPRWRAAAILARADTGEAVVRLSVFAASAAEAEAQLAAQIEGALAALSKPRDWGRDPTVPRLLRSYLRLRDEAYGMCERARGAAAAEAYEREAMEALRRQVEALTESQRLELATATEEELLRRDDPHMLDALTARSRLCELLSARSPAVEAARVRLTRALDRLPPEP